MPSRSRATSSGVLARIGRALNLEEAGNPRCQARNEARQREQTPYLPAGRSPARVRRVGVEHAHAFAGGGIFPRHAPGSFGRYPIAAVYHQTAGNGWDPP